MPEPPYRRFGVLALEMRGGDLVSDAAAAARAGVDGMSVGTLELQRRGTAEVARVFADAGLTVSSVGAISPSLTGERDEIDHALEVLEATAALAAPGVIALTGPLGALSAGDADAECRRWLERVAPRAAELGTVVMLEPVFPMMRGYSYVHTLSHALELVADLEGAAVVVDIGHLWWEPRLLEQFRAHVDDIGTVQLTNMSSDALDRLRYSRAPLDDGAVPLRELVLAFDSAGYRGWYEHEVLTKEPTDRVQFVRDARDWFEAVWE